MMAEVAVRTIRWLSDPDFLVRKNAAWAQDTEWFDAHMLWEQDILNDAACSAAAGRYASALLHSRALLHSLRCSLPACVCIAV